MYVRFDEIKRHDLIEVCFLDEQGDSVYVTGKAFKAIKDEDGNRIGWESGFTNSQFGFLASEVVSIKRLLGGGQQLASGF